MRPEKALTLVSAEAGYGKTTLLSEYVRHLDLPVVYLPLGPEARDLPSFLIQMERAAVAAMPGISHPVSDLALSSQSPERIARNAMGALIEAMGNEASRFVLVIDDLHAIAEAPSVVAAIETLIELLPESAQMIAATRPEPPIRLSSLRLAMRLLELSASDLRLSPSQVAKLLASYGAEQLNADELVLKTEGWVAGVVLAARLRDPRLVRGKTHDFLGEEIFDRLGPGAKSFMLACAIAPEFDEVLCREVLGFEEASSLLSDLEDSIGFVQVTERPHGRMSYRFHPMFREFLIERGRRALDAEHRRQLYLRIGEQWLDLEPGVGIRILLDGGHQDAAVRALARIGPELLQTNRQVLLSTLLERIPSPVVAGDGQLLLLQGEVARAAGRYDEALASLQRASSLAEAAGDELLQGRALAFQSAIHGARGEAGHDALAREALRLLPASDHGGRAFAHNVLGGAALLDNRPTEAIASFRAALSDFRAAGDLAGQAKANHNLGLLHARLGEFPVATRCYRQAMRLSRQAGRVPMPITLNNLATIHLYQGQHEEARQLVEEGLRLAGQLGAQRDAVFLLWTLGEINLKEGLLQQAHECFRRSREEAATIEDRASESQAMAGLAEVLRASGQTSEALELVEEAIALRQPDASDPTYGDLVYAWVSVLVQDGQLDRASRLLERAEPYLAALNYRYRLFQLDRCRRRLERAREANGAASPEAEQASILSVTDISGPELRIQLFGAFQVFRAGEPVPSRSWQGSKTKAILAFLVLHPEGATKDQLLELLFAEQDPARSAVHVLITRLRQALEPALERNRPSRYIQLVDGRYQLNRAALVEADVTMFDRLWARAAREEAPQRIATLKEALVLYRGPLLAEFGFDWCLPTAEHYRRRCHEAFDLLFAYHEAAADYANLLDTAEQAIALDPFHEEAHRAKMLGLMALDKRELAIRHYEQIVRLFERELAMAPGMALQSLFEELRAPNRSQAARPARDVRA